MHKPFRSCFCSQAFNQFRKALVVFFAELNSTYDLEFPSSGITDYLVIEDPFGDRNLTAVTISMWMKTNDKNNQGTPVSYATDTYDNALVITDYTG